MVLPSSETTRPKVVQSPQSPPELGDGATTLQRLVSVEEQASFDNDGAVVLKGILPSKWVDHLRRGFDSLEHQFGPDALIERPKDGEGRYVNEQLRWRVVPEFYDFALNSPGCELAATLMHSVTANLFIDQYFIKDPGTVLPTPWHQDLPYLSVSAQQIVRLWVPTDPMPKEMSLEVALGSHRDHMLYRPVPATRSATHRYDESMPEMPTEEEIRQRWKIASWDTEPGDCVAFHGAILHGSPGGVVKGGGRRHVAAFLWAGDDARYKVRPGRNMPPLPVPGVKDGGRLDSASFPRVWPRPIAPDVAAMRPPRPPTTP